MKIKNSTCFTAVCSLIAAGSVFLSCNKGQGVPRESNTSTTARSVINNSMTLAQINARIDSAGYGDTIFVAPGTYSLTGKIKMKPGIVFAKQSSANPVFDATALADILTLSYKSEISHSSFLGITFWNIRFVVDSAIQTKFRYCLFDYGKRKAGTDENFYADAYIQFSNTDSALVQNSVFCRRSGNSGRGIWLKPGVTNNRILNCTFGNGGSTGYFVTAINDNSKSNSLIQGNTISRNTALNADNLQTDHGIYAHSFNGVSIKNNTISGWPANADGGAVKARNGQYLVIDSNTFNHSGVMLYEYSSTPAYPYLKYVQVINNTIDIDSPVNDMYHGIGYWRNNTTGTEYSIRIANNQLPNGTIHFNSSNLNVDNFNAENGGVYDNNMGLLKLKTGINHSGNY